MRVFYVIGIHCRLCSIAKDQLYGIACLDDNLFENGLLGGGKCAQHMIRYTRVGFRAPDADAKPDKAIFSNRFQHGLYAFVSAVSAVILDLQSPQFKIDIIMNNQQPLDLYVEVAQQGVNRRTAAVHVFHGFCKNCRNGRNGTPPIDCPKIRKAKRYGKTIGNFVRHKKSGIMTGKLVSFPRIA